MTVNDTGLPEDERTVASGGTLEAWHLVVLAVVAVALVAAGYWWFAVRDRAGDGPPTAGVTKVPEGSRIVSLFFAEEDEAALFSETRQVAIGRSLIEQCTQVMRALIAGPEGSGVSAIPSGTRLLGVYYDEEMLTFFLDFSGELVAAHPGGAAAEYSTVMAIMKTTSENFPEVRAVQILVDGYQVGTIAGHIDAYKPFDVRDWR